MNKKLTLDQIESLLETMDPEDIREEYEGMIDKEGFRFLSAFENLDDNLEALKYLEKPPSFVAPKPSISRYILPVAAILISGFLLYIGLPEKQRELKLEEEDTSTFSSTPENLEQLSRELQATEPLRDLPGEAEEPVQANEIGETLKTKAREEKKAERRAVEKPAPAPPQTEPSHTLDSAARSSTNENRLASENASETMGRSFGFTSDSELTEIQEEARGPALTAESGSVRQAMDQILEKEQTSISQAKTETVNPILDIDLGVPYKGKYRQSSLEEEADDAAVEPELSQVQITQVQRALALFLEDWNNGRALSNVNQDARIFWPLMANQTEVQDAVTWYDSHGQKGNRTLSFTEFFRLGTETNQQTVLVTWQMKDRSKVLSQAAIEITLKNGKIAAIQQRKQ